MTYTAPTAADLQERYPEFASVNFDRIALVLDEAAAEVGDTWIEADRRPATLALAAHLLAAEGALSENQTVGASLPGEVVGIRVGDVQTTFAKPGATSSGVSAEDFGSTVYGRRFLMLRRRSFPAVLAV
ncbi:DUF4054 domain-containing protein [Alsobacter sp. KACC 23698]|uniref:DUF4054 domain-containing protein n=1 Tax=Alsobacter sp. KACC 23698 TaxID=3149229 RepID=A0AAU7JMK2_9HYPH